MNDTIASAFNATMQREGQTAITHYGAQSFQCFFRRNNDGEKSKDTMIMYYYADCPIRCGSLIDYAGNTYLVLNCETAENTIYRKSAVVKTNGMINTASVSNLPFYGEGINSASADENKFISVIDGKIEIQTIDNAESRQIAINDTFTEWGRTFKVTNRYYINGMTNIIAEVTTDAEEYTYTMTILPFDVVNVIPGDTSTMQVSIYRNDEPVTGASIVYASSDDGIATIDNTGAITYIADGIVHFTATCSAYSLSADSVEVTVATEASGNNVEIYVTPISSVYANLPETLTCYATVGGARDDDIDISFRAENLTGTWSNPQLMLQKIQIAKTTNNQVEIEVKTANLIGQTFDFVAYSELYDVENRQTIRITDF